MGEKDHINAIKDCDVEYQKNQHQALNNEMGRATRYYDKVLWEVQQKIEDEQLQVDNLYSELNKLEVREKRLAEEAQDMEDSMARVQSKGKHEIHDSEIERLLDEVEEAE